MKEGVENANLIRFVFPSLPLAQGHVLQI